MPADARVVIALQRFQRANVGRQNPQLAHAAAGFPVLSVQRQDRHDPLVCEQGSPFIVRRTDLVGPVRGFA